jgi:YbbR domain-containing protein
VHNWRLKLSALGLSVFLWALVQTEPRNAETFSAVPVEVDVADTSWTASGPPTPSTVELRLTGPTREIIRLAREGTLVRVPIREVGSADTVVTLRRDWVALGEGRGVSVESLNPSTVRIVLEPAASRVVPLRVRTQGSLPGHLALASPIGLNPHLVRVRGPASRIQGLDSMPLLPLDLDEITKSGVHELPVDTAGLHGVRVMPPTATVGIRVEEEVERVLSGVPVIVRSPGGSESLSVSPTAVDVTLRGARTLVTAVNPADLRVWVSPELLSGMTPGEERRVPVKVEGVPALVSSSVPDDIVTVRAPGERVPGAVP